MIISFYRAVLQMTEKDLKKLSRAELLKLLIMQTQENERLTAENESIKKQLMDRKIIINNAGSIADASLKLNGIFEAAEEAAREYIDNIRLYSERQDTLLLETEGTAQKNAETMLSDAEQRAKTIVSDAHNMASRITIDAERRAKAQEANSIKACEEMKRNAQKEAEGYWNRVSEKINEYLSKHPELRDAISEKKN